MEMDLLKQEIEEIEMPLDMQERILEKCKKAEEQLFYMENLKQNRVADENQGRIEDASDNRIMNKGSRKKTKKLPRFATVAAAVVLCLGVGGVTAMAASDKLEGFFSDVTRWDGAVVGTTYEQATEEIEVSASVSGDSLVVDAVLLKAGEAPYIHLDSFGIQAYQIQDKEGNMIVEGSTFETADIIDDKVSMVLLLDELENGSYTLIITEFVGRAKAEQDLPVKGYWVCEFEL